MRRIVLMPFVVVAVLAGCGGSGDTAAPTSTSRLRPPASRPTTTSNATTTAPPADSFTTSTTAGCPTVGSTAPVNDGFPDRKSGLVGKEVRTGAHPCFERFVLELAPTGTSDQFPGSFVRYVPKPIALAPSDQPISIRGTAVLMVSLGSWMNGPEGGYEGPKDVVPTNVGAIREVRLVEDFEGQSAWALGLDRTRAFHVTTLDAPPRLVVDVATG